ncbi:MAG: gliding motility-associated C-terminal domain-containing protein [Ferruginibacter sp.]
MLLKKYLFLLFILTLSCFYQTALSQCTTPISTFPYNEGFESTDGNWVPSSNIHWEWGQINSKPVITAAGAGSKCWIAGGLTGSSYNSGSSYLQSPCFDLSSLSIPQISFKVFWETERKYDGASIEYSTNGGSSWSVLGSINSNSNCSGQNWFNYAPVNFLGGPGWSGNIQPTSGSCQGTGGSAGWLTAKHTLSSIAGSNAVIFRFVFAAGTTCNNFDGFAIDDVNIGETPASGADFTYSCSGNNAVTFMSTSAPCKTSVSWDFDDTGSGANNISALDDPSHIFSAAGTYTVTLTTNFTSGPSIVVAKDITVVSVSALIDSIDCNGSNAGSVTVSVNPAGSYSYTWNTNPVAVTPVISNLSAGTYTVIISGTNTCNTSLPVVVTEPAVLDIRPTVTDARCGFNNGSITTIISGGTPPYDYAWSNMAVTPSITSLAPGNYSLLLTDNKGCTAAANNLQVNNVVNNVSVILGADKFICPGQVVVLDPGIFSSYKWQDNSINRTFSVTQTGIYSVTVTDAGGCTGYGSIKVTVDCPEVYFPSAFTPDGNTTNDGFGALGSLSTINNYKLDIYGRWGEIVFNTNDPFKKWDGTYKGKLVSTQSFVWIATYSLGSYLPETRRGTVLLIR